MSVNPGGTITQKLVIAWMHRHNTYLPISAIIPTYRSVNASPYSVL